MHQELEKQRPLGRSRIVRSAARPLPADY